MKDRAIGLVEIPVARDTLQLPPGWPPDVR